MNIRTTLYATGLLSIVAACPALLSAQGPAPDPQNMDWAAVAAATTTVTNVTGTITQLNYGPGGTVEGFLIDTNILLEFRGNVTGGIGTLAAVGNSVTYSGTALTNSSGFQTVRVSSFTNNTTKASYTSTRPTAATYGPTSGTVKQLNYDGNGAIDGFVFTPGGTTTAVFVATGSQAGATLKPLLTVGGTVSVTGTTTANQPANACASTGALQVVEASSLLINGQTIVVATGHSGRGGRR